MNSAEQFERICRAMSEPSFYPHPASSIERRETHISVVFLAGEWVYKLKKHKDLGFLDFRDPVRRLHYCMQEWKLNKRLSFGVYQGVVGIHEDEAGALALGPVEGALEYAVKMTRLPDGVNFETLLRTGAVTQEHLTRLGEILASFHDSAERGDGIDAFGDPEHVRFNMEENFAQILPFAHGFLNLRKWEFIRQVCRSFLNNHGELFMHRVREGRIRDGHGDLRAEHVYFHQGVQVIDCIEFNERFRYGDCALDLAFLIMDLDRLGFDEVGRRLLWVYAAVSRDAEVYALMDFYAAYRAFVRLKVACFSLEHIEDRAAAAGEIRDYLDQAYRYAVSFGRPVLWVFCGLPASGKSTLARRVAKALFMSHLASDTVRKEDHDFPADGVVAYNTGAYRPVVRGRVYAKLLNLAQEELRKGRSVVLDATFSSAQWRESAMLLAKDQNAGLIFVHCVCSPQTIKARLANREASSGESDARLIHFDDIIKNFEPFDDTADTYLAVSTERSEDDSLYAALSQGCALRQVQAQSLIKGLDATPHHGK
ncbi:MAG: AAA family ATPase [Desulfomicrobium sp.]|nr:AAA family ATPase [Desulfomicrobium sp.]